jgi:hypothetical protein
LLGGTEVLEELKLPDPKKRLLALVALKKLL